MVISQQTAQPALSVNFYLEQYVYQSVLPELLGTFRLLHVTHVM